MITISCAVMHTVCRKDRRESLERMIQELGENNIISYWQDFQIFGDMFQKGSWWNAKRCMEWGAALKTSHHLILQDDCKFSEDFVAGLKTLIAVWPNEIICLFFGPRKGFKEGGRWGEAEGPWGQAIIYPQSLLKEFLIWEKNNIKPEFKHDDSRVALFCASTGRTVKVPFPNVVDHMDEMQSTMNHRGFVPRVSDNFLKESIYSIDWNDVSNIRQSINSVSNDKKWLIDENIS